MVFYFFKNFNFLQLSTCIKIRVLRDCNGNSYILILIDQYITFFYNKWR